MAHHKSRDGNHGDPQRQRLRGVKPGDRGKSTRPAIRAARRRGGKSINPCAPDSVSSETEGEALQILKSRSARFHPTRPLAAAEEQVGEAGGTLRLLRLLTAPIMLRSIASWMRWRCKYSCRPSELCK